MASERQAHPASLAVVFGLAASAVGCGSEIRTFPLRDAMWQDGDLRPAPAQCHIEPSPKDPKHVSCAPELYVSPLAWDGVDNSIFRPLSEVFAIARGGEALNVNSLDEVPDSAWFTNRIGRRPVTIDELARGACEPSQLLEEAETAADGTWIIDKGKDNGSSPGFRVRVPGKGKYMLKSDDTVPEHPSAASVIGAAAYNAVGFNTSCEQIIYIKPSAFKLSPGLTVTDNFDVTRPFDEAALKRIVDGATHRGDHIRLQASAWLPGYLIGPFRYEKVREDDPNDVVPHEDRRDLRGGRLLAAWLDHFDAREQNSMDTWLTADKNGEPDASPGFVRHYYLDTSDILGSEWEWDEVSRRLGHSYLLDWGYIGADFVSLGIPTRPWDRATREPGEEIFGYFNARNFSPEDWVNEYPNPAFSRMTERDGAWMARILAHFTPDLVRRLAEMGRLSEPRHTAYLTTVLEGRLEAILTRYLLALSPLTDFHVDHGNRLCGEDLARERLLRPVSAFRYDADLRVEGSAPRPLVATVTENSEVCVELPNLDGDLGPPSAPGRYVVVRISNGAAKWPIYAHLYDLGPSLGYRLAGIERAKS
jgi:hypothetical protein